MREKLSWYLDPTEDELDNLWQEATFSVDANVLLDLYRVDRTTTEDLFQIYQRLGDRLFLTNEAANQFFLQRRGVIRTERASFEDAKEDVENWAERRKHFNDIKGELRGDNAGDIIASEVDDVFDNREEYEEEVEVIKEDILERIADLEEEYRPAQTLKANSGDAILGDLLDLFEEKTGDPYPFSDDGGNDIEQVQRIAKDRYENDKPPGYNDYGGSGFPTRGQCEDYIIWRQLMQYAREHEVDVVFVTKEEKSDWWETDPGNNIVRPRHELLREFNRETGQAFWMLHYEDFLESANERFELDIDDSVEQASSVGDEEETDYSDLFGNPLPKEGYTESEANTIHRFLSILRDIYFRMNNDDYGLSNVDDVKGDLDKIIYSCESINDILKEEDEIDMFGVWVDKEVVEESVIRGDTYDAKKHKNDLLSEIELFSKSAMEKLE